MQPLSRKTGRYTECQRLRTRDDPAAHWMGRNTDRKIEHILFVYNMPFRAIARMTGGMVSDEMVEDILYMVNGHAIRGLGRLISDFFRNQSANKGFIKQLEELDDRKQ